MEHHRARTASAGLALKTKHELKKETLVLNFCIWNNCSGTDTNMLEEHCKNSDGVKKTCYCKVTNVKKKKRWWKSRKNAYNVNTKWNISSLYATYSDCNVEMPMFLCFDVICFSVTGFNFVSVELFPVLNMFLVPIQFFQIQMFQCQYFLFQFRFCFQCRNSLSLFYSHRIFFNSNMRVCFNDILEECFYEWDIKRDE